MINVLLSQIDLLLCMKACIYMHLIFVARIYFDVTLLVTSSFISIFFFPFVHSYFSPSYMNYSLIQSLLAFSFFIVPSLYSYLSEQFFLFSFDFTIFVPLYLSGFGTCKASHKGNQHEDRRGKIPCLSDTSFTILQQQVIFGK